MDLRVQPGRYVVAVSGGVDSMVLLDMLVKQANSNSLIANSSGQQLSAISYQLIVAHFDHGIRDNSIEDRRLVQRVAVAHGLPFCFEEGKLGPGASEARARTARYGFLERVRLREGAEAIITAHHQDDLLETMILNLLRGTGRKGLAGLGDRPTVLRPLLHASKVELIEYARSHHLAWREDSTNADDRYARNYIRHQLVPKLTSAARSRLLELAEQTRRTNAELDSALAALLPSGATARLDRRLFIRLPHAASKELLASWLRLNGIAQFDTLLLERVTVAAKTQVPGAIIDLIGGARIRVAKGELALEHVER